MRRYCCLNKYILYSQFVIKYIKYWPTLNIQTIDIFVSFTNTAYFSKVNLKFVKTNALYGYIPLGWFLFNTKLFRV